MRKFYEYLSHTVYVLVCRVRGHEWMSDDYGNSESGYMGAHCERCHIETGSVLY